MSEAGLWDGEIALAQGVAEIEVFGEADLDAIYAIEERAHADAWQRRHFTGSLQQAHHHCLGARRAGDWLGYAVVSCIGGEAELLLLVVDVPWQRQGVATGLLDHLCQRLSASADNLFLEVRAGNTRARQLYEKLGFNQVGVRPGYYGRGRDREDAYLYARALLA